MAKEATQTKRRRIDPSTLSPEERAAYEAARAPKPAFLAYNVSENGELNVVLATRSADDALAALDEDRSLKLARFKIK